MSSVLNILILLYKQHSLCCVPQHREKLCNFIPLFHWPVQSSPKCFRQFSVSVEDGSCHNTSNKWPSFTHQCQHATDVPAQKEHPLQSLAPSPTPLHACLVCPPTLPVTGMHHAILILQLGFTNVHSREECCSLSQPEFQLGSVLQPHHSPVPNLAILKTKPDLNHTHALPPFHLSWRTSLVTTPRSVPTQLV